MNLFELENYKKMEPQLMKKEKESSDVPSFFIPKSFPLFFPLSTLTQLAEGKTKKSIRLGQEKRGNIVHALSIFFKQQKKWIFIDKVLHTNVRTSSYSKPSDASVSVISTL